MLPSPRPMPDLDPVRAAALANAVELARSTEPIVAEAAHEVAQVVTDVADVFVAWLRGET